MFRALAAAVAASLEARPTFNAAVLDEVAERHGWAYRQAAARMLSQPGRPNFREVADDIGVAAHPRNAPAVADRVAGLVEDSPFIPEPPA